MIDTVARRRLNATGSGAPPKAPRPTSAIATPACHRGEQQVMALVTAGKMNEQVGFELGLSEIAAEDLAWRREMQKMAGAELRGPRAHGQRAPRSARLRAVRRVTCG